MKNRAAGTGLRAVLTKAGLTIEAALALPLLLFCLVTMISFMDIYRIQTEHLVNLCQSAIQEGIDAGGETITAQDSYSVTPVQTLFRLPAVPFENSVTVRGWTGEEGASHDVTAGNEPEKMVYMTASGSVIHLDPHCSYLDIHITSVSGDSIESRRNSEGERYHACERCSYGEDPAGIVYITNSGSSYHNSGACSGLKRTVRLIPESAAGGAGYCSRCGGG